MILLDHMRAGVARSIAGRRLHPLPRRVRAVLISHDADHADRLEERCRARAELAPTDRSGGAVLDVASLGSVDVAVVDLGGLAVDATWLVGVLRARHANLRLVICGDDVTLFNEVFDAGADAWVARHANTTTLAAAMTGSFGRQTRGQRLWSGRVVRHRGWA